MKPTDVESFSRRIGGCDIALVLGDITKDHGVDAIVNAANTTLLGGGGVDGAIHRAAGPGLLAECRGLGGCRTGEARITGAYDLPCRYVIHTPGPVWRGGAHGEKELLESCYRSSLALAAGRGIRRIAFSSISTGVYSYPLEDAAMVAVGLAVSYLREHENEFDVIKWVLFDEKTFACYRNALTEVAASIESV
ncbi:MAG: O-acetyl-ADP-ribose deacetylase [Succinivibrionaceae bacterium]|nr:O-acetyl-ADP-ribose deacetylase [Succinivibrionaceae bacterium]